MAQTNTQLAWDELSLAQQSETHAEALIENAHIDALDEDRYEVRRLLMDDITHELRVGAHDVLYLTPRGDDELVIGIEGSQDQEYQYVIKIETRGV